MHLSNHFLKLVFHVMLRFQILLSLVTHMPSALLRLDYRSHFTFLLFIHRHWYHRWRSILNVSWIIKWPDLHVVVTTEDAFYDWIVRGI